MKLYMHPRSSESIEASMTTIKPNMPRKDSSSKGHYSGRLCATQFHDYVLRLIKSFGADTLPDTSSISHGTGNRKAIVTVSRLSVYLLH